MHDAKTRLSELVKRVEDHGEKVVLCRNGEAIAEISAVKPAGKRNRLRGNPALMIEVADGFDPVEGATEQDWPAAFR